MTGGTVSVEAYRAAATGACSSANVDQPWACIDLVYVVTLLQDAYKIDNNEPISVRIPPYVILFTIGCPVIERRMIILLWEVAYECVLMKSTENIGNYI